MKYLLTDWLEYDMKLSSWIYNSTHNLWRIHIILLSAMEFVEFHEVIEGVFKEAILEKNFSKSKPF